MAAGDKASDQRVDGSGLQRRWLLVWPALVVITALAQWPWLNLPDDVRFTLGALRTADIPLPALEAFAHRPMAHRVLMAGLDALTGGPLPLREKMIMVLAITGAAGAAALLHLALLRRTSRSVAALVSLAVFGSLAWASEPYTLQPEWTATVLGVAAVGLALAGRRRTATRLLLGAAALVLAVAVLQKYTTVTVAALAIMVVWAFDRRRAVGLMITTGLATLLLFVITLVSGSHEWQWFRETPALNPSVGIRWDAFSEWAINVGWNNPVLLLWPAAAALAAALTGRRIFVVGSLLAFGGVLVVIMVQNQFFSYHAVPLLPVAAGVSAFAVARWAGSTGRLLVGLLPLGVWVGICELLLRQPIGARSASRGAVAVGLLSVIIVVAVMVWRQRVSWARSGSPRSSTGPTALTVMAVLLTVAVTFPAWPGTPYGLFGLDHSRRSEIERQKDLVTEAAGVRAVVGSARVAYLADGEAVYVIGSRTDCRYPPAVVLYRSEDAAVGRLRSFAENLDCLRSASAAFLVVQTWRVPFDQLDPRVGAVVEQTYDCGVPATSVGHFIVCPRR